MFNQRQLEILLELCENTDTYMTASHFAGKHQVSLRTVQNDIKHMKAELEDEASLTFTSVPPKGSIIHVVDSEEFALLKARLYQQFTNASTNYQSERVSQLIVLLLNQHRSTSLYDIENTLFISRSTLVNDLKHAEAILSRYGIELMRSSNKVMIDGTELNKRRCLSEENLLVVNPGPLSHGASGSNRKTKIKNILVEAFVHYRYNVSELAMNNAIVVVDSAVRRIEDFFFIDESDLNITTDLGTERDISSYIYRRLEEKFHLRVPDAEINYFAIYLKGQGNYSRGSVISQEMNDFILDALRGIRKTFNIDLTDDLDLRIALALHCTSLIVRIQYDMQLKNHLVDYIRQTYPFGYDVAVYFASILQERYGKKVTADEIAFLAIHFYKSIMDVENSTGTRRLLVITSMRRSENILLRQTLYSWFDEQIAELRFIFPEEMEASMLDEYDTVITTEKGRFYDMGVALYINQFPDRQDYLNLKLAMDGFESISDILEIFHSGQFVYFDQGNISKQEILTTLCRNASEAYGLEGLEEAVMERENMRSTFFGNGIAAAHPMSAVSSNTFVCVGVSRESVEWDSQHNKVNLVLLVGIGKNNAKAFQLWSYLSRLFSDKTIVKKLLAHPNYDNFMKLLKRAIADGSLRE